MEIVRTGAAVPARLRRKADMLVDLGISSTIWLGPNVAVMLAGIVVLRNGCWDVSAVHVMWGIIITV